MNAKKILADGFLYSREQLERERQILTDIASPRIIGTTSPKWKKYIRLYFRPRTPMQYSNEGIRPKDKLEYGAHCPVPVVFVFDAPGLLTLPETEFSNGNLRAKDVMVDDSVDFYLSLPFNKIY
ncbi:MAG: DUF4433 domain-containing protein, partial [bacterium]|nr:DUF4433 domain-containing protein [bacterium]